jgi:hypothetical protein
MLPFYMPNELLEYSEIYDNMLQEVLSENLGEAFEIWRSEVIKNRDNKVELEKLGWNYRYSPITEEGINKSELVFNSKLNLNYVLVEDIKDMVTTELTPVFIVITGNNSLVAKGIKFVTNSKYSHVSLSFHENLDRLYSFGLDLSGKVGFAIENFQKTFMKDKKFDPDLKVFCVLVPKQQAKQMKLKLDTILARKDKLGYSYIGIMGYLFNKNINISDKMFCSQFVDSMFKFVGIDLTHKPSGLVSPDDLSNIKSDKDMHIFKLFEGKASEYDYNKLKLKAAI